MALFFKTHNQGYNEMTYTFSVPEIMCEHCENAVTTAVKAVDGVNSVNVDLSTKIVTIDGKDGIEEFLRTAIENQGYDVK